MSAIRASSSASDTSSATRDRSCVLPAAPPPRGGDRQASPNNRAQEADRSTPPEGWPRQENRRSNLQLIERRRRALVNSPRQQSGRRPRSGSGGMRFELRSGVVRLLSHDAVGPTVQPARLHARIHNRMPTPHTQKLGRNVEAQEGEVGRYLGCRRSGSPRWTATGRTGGGVKRRRVVEAGFPSAAAHQQAFDVAAAAGAISGGVILSLPR